MSDSQRIVEATLLEGEGLLKAIHNTAGKKVRAIFDNKLDVSETERKNLLELAGAIDGREAVKDKVVDLIFKQVLREVFSSEHVIAPGDFPKPDLSQAKLYYSSPALRAKITEIEKFFTLPDQYYENAEFRQRTLYPETHCFARSLVSFRPAECHFTVKFLELKSVQKKLENEALRIFAKLGDQFDENIPFSLLLKESMRSSYRLLSDLKLHSTVKVQARAEVRQALLSQLIKVAAEAGALPERNVRLACTIARDELQSNEASKFSSKDRIKLFKSAMKLGIDIEIQEVTGGAVLEMLLKNHLECSWQLQEDIVKAQWQAVHDRLYPGGKNPYGITDDIINKLHSKFDLAKSLSKREVFETGAVRELLENNLILDPMSDKELIDDIVRIYNIKLSELCRGINLYALTPFSPFLVKEIVKERGEVGVNITRTFESNNDTSRMLTGIGAARDAGIGNQVVLHWDPDTTLSNKALAMIAKNLLDAGGPDSVLCIKDAAGNTVRKPVQIAELIKALRVAGITNAIAFHTHATAGTENEALLYVQLANGKRPLIIDFGLGKGFGAASLGQPDLYGYVQMTEGTHWSPKGKPEYADGIKEIELQMWREVYCNYPKLVEATTEERLLLYKSQTPGGMKTSYDPEIRKEFLGLSKVIDEMLEAQLGISGLSVVNVTGKDKKLSELGKLVYKAFYRTVLNTKRKVHKDVPVPQVTPGSQYEGSTALAIVSALIKDKTLKITQTLVKDNTTDSTQTKKYKITLETPWKNNDLPVSAYNQQALNTGFTSFLLFWSQSENIPMGATTWAPSLKDLYPNVSREVAKLAVTSLCKDLGDYVDHDLLQSAFNGETVDARLVKKAFAKLQPILDTLELPLVSSAVLGIARSLKQSGVPAESIRNLSAKELKDRVRSVEHKVSLVGSWAELKDLYESAPQKICRRLR